MNATNTLRDHLAAARHELLDLGLRNPLLSWRPSKARGLDIVDELPQAVYRILVEQGRVMSFQHVPEQKPATVSSAVRGTDLFASTGPEEDIAAILARYTDDGQADSVGADSAPASRYIDSRLQTPYMAKELQSRLLASFYAARTFVQEQGVNVLYLAVGMLEWYEDPSSTTARKAPLLLIPVELERTDVRASFRLRYTGEDVGGNLTLQAKLRNDFGLKLPLPNPESDLDLDAYLKTVADIVRGQARWRVDAKAIHVGFFLFGKLLMYNDLAVEAWPDDASPLTHPVLGALLGDGFRSNGERLGDDEHLDRHLHPDDVHQVVDADGTQTLALLDVKQGHHLVIQGLNRTGFTGDRIT